eukprot:15238928-Alexandrium_andersonii.AAC.1
MPGRVTSGGLPLCCESIACELMPGRMNSDGACVPASPRISVCKPCGGGCNCGPAFGYASRLEWAS